MITGAKHRLLIENEEMNDDTVTAALEQAARRHVAVTVVMNANARWTGALDQLRSAGVQVIEVPDTSGALYIHAKVDVADLGTAGERAFIGSQNFSVASLRYNRELGVLTSDPRAVATLTAVVTADAHSQPR